MFSALFDWDRCSEAIVDLTGDDTTEGMLGLDQMGHFGPTACQLVADHLSGSLDGNSAIRLAELGAGFGGALRYVVAELRRRAVDVSAAFAFELVAHHARLSVEINRSTRTYHCHSVCADAADMPVRAGSIDAIFVTGSMPHFSDTASVLRAAAHALRPGGVFVATEEVSLLGDAQVDDDFLACHPPGVFSFTTPQARRAELVAAGLTVLHTVDLTAWATDLLTARRKALKLFYGTAEGILGVRQTARIVTQLEVTQRQYERSALVPMLLVGRKP